MKGEHLDIPRNPGGARLNRASVGVKGRCVQKVRGV